MREREPYSVLMENSSVFDKSYVWNHGGLKGVCQRKLQHFHEAVTCLLISLCFCGRRRGEHACWR